MKLVSFAHDGRESFGIWTETGIIDLGKRAPGGAQSLKDVLDRLEDIAVYASAEPDHSHADVQLLPPVHEPGKILCVGLNYKSHIAETGRDAPQFPILFARYPSSIVGHGADMVRPRASLQYDYEGELAFVIGKGGRHISPENALAHVAGFSCFNDGSVRDWQRHTSQFLPGKSFWRSGSFGPWLVTPDEVGAIGNLALSTRLNGETMQTARLDDLLFGVPELIVYISTIMPLEPGDVVATGTTGGVGLFRKPPLFMKAGDRVEIEIEKLGTLANEIVDEP